MLEIKVWRAQAYATILDSRSYNYKYEREAPKFDSSIDGGSLCARACLTTQYWGKEKYIEYVKSGTIPDFTEEIQNCLFWLEKHKDRENDPMWSGAFSGYRKDIDFFSGGYMEKAKCWQHITVKYIVETLPPYSLGTFDTKSANEKCMPFIKDEKFIHIDEGFILK